MSRSAQRKQGPQRPGAAIGMALPVATVVAFIGAALAVAAPPGMIAGARAQTADQDSVLSRPRPDFDPQCVALDAPASDSAPAGLVQLCPGVTVSGGYGDNILRTESGVESDTFVVVEPQLTLQADGEAFDATIDARGALTRHQDLSRNDSDDYEARAAGRADVTDDLTIAASAAYGRFHEGRESPDDVSALLDVTEFTLSREHLAFEYRPVDWLLRIAGEARQYDFRDTGPVDNDDRDRDEYEVIVRLGRNFLPGLTLFVEPTYNIRRYRNVPDSAGLIRDSDGFDVRAGATYDLTGVTFLELSGGYFRQDFDDPAFGAESGFSVQGRVIWNPTDVLTVTGEVSRAVSESTLATVSGVVGTAVGVGLDYEIRDFLLLSGRAAYLNSDFGSSGRNDDTYRGSLALIGLVNDYMSLTARYEYAERLSNALGEDFRSNTFLLSLDLQF